MEAVTEGAVPFETEFDPERYESLSPDGDVFRKVLDTETREVLVQSEVGVEDYDELAEELGPWAVRDMQYLKARSAVLAEYEPDIEEVNPTANGGGVQMILCSQTNLLNKIDPEGRIHDHWRLMLPNARGFRATKDWHNTFQGVATHTREHLLASFATYEDWIRTENAEPLRPYLQQASIVTIHDPQPNLLIDEIPQDTPLVWRSHIQNRTDLISQPGSPQELVWDYVYKGKVDRADAHVYHPVEEFVPHNVPDSLVNFGPATFDPFDDLNRRNLTETERRDGKDFIDSQLIASAANKPVDVADDIDWEQTPIDWDRRKIAVIARFDPSKGMPEGLESYVMARQMMVEQGMPLSEIPQYILYGNGSIDDPDGIIEQNKMMELRSQLPEDVRDDVKVIRAPHNDTAINVLMDETELGEQPSLEEGLETRVSDWIWHGKPVLGSSRGGIGLQIIEGQSGYIMDPTNIRQWADKIVQIFTDRSEYDRLCAGARELGRTYNYREFSTVANAIRWVDLYIDLLQGRANGSRRWRISEIVDGESEQASTARLRNSLGAIATA